VVVDAETVGVDVEETDGDVAAAERVETERHGWVILLVKE